MTITRDCVLKPRVYTGLTTPPQSNGGTVEDISRYGNNLTREGAGTDYPEWHKLPSGLWVDHFESANDEYFNGVNTPSLQLTERMTLMIWFHNLTAFGAATHVSIMGKSTAFTVNGYGLDVYDNKLRFYVGASAAIGGTALGDNTWVHYAGTYEKTGGANNQKVYLNAVNDGQQTNAAGCTDQATTFKIGMVYAAVNYFNGYLTFCTVFNYELTAAQIYGIFQKERGWFGV